MAVAQPPTGRSATISRAVSLPCASSPIRSSCATVRSGRPPASPPGSTSHLALLEEDLGRDVALAVARYLVVFLKRPGGQAQFSAALSLQAGEAPFGRLHAWIDANLARDLSLSTLAAQAGMSERSFSRRYLEATGLTPARAVERLRVEAARRLLSDTRAPIKRIARQCGFGTEETMRRSFLRLLSTSPQDYRARFSP